MIRRSKVSTKVVILLVIILGVSLGPGTFTRANKQSPQETKKAARLESPSQEIQQAQTEKASIGGAIFSIPVGGEGINYKGGDVADTQTWGPASLRIAPDGTFLITDTVGNKVLRYRLMGAKINPIKVTGVTAITDVAVKGSEIFALDDAATEPTVYRLSADGVLQESLVLPPKLRAKGLSGLTLNEYGEVTAELGGGASAASLYEGGHEGKTLGGERLSTWAPNLGDKTSDPSTGFISIGDSKITVKVKNVLGGLSVLGTRPDGDFFVLVEELSDTHVLQVDQTVRKYSRDGSLLGMARVPLAERYTYVRNGVAVAPDGNVYALITRPDRADVIRLQFSRSLMPILPPAKLTPTVTRKPVVAETGSEQKSTALAALGCRSRDDMINMAWSYINNWTYLTNTNLNRSCKGRQKPSYLVNASEGWFSSVPYDWGGEDTPDEFNQHMAQGLAAGDLDDTAIEECSQGVDCSGFVSRCWGINAAQRLSTRGLPNASYPITLSQVQKGDIFNLYDEHVVMVESIVSNGVMTLEATAFNSYDRAVYIYNGWSRFNRYKFYKYKNACDAAPARPVVTSSLTLSTGSTASVGQYADAYFTITNRGSQSITLSKLLVGGRYNGTECCMDFSITYNVTLAPGESHYYYGWRYLDRAGTHSVFVAYQKTDGRWVTNVDTENGARKSMSLRVQQNARPILDGHWPNVSARWWDQTIYLYGERLRNTVYMYVVFPDGGGAFIYPPGQIFSRSYGRLGCKITFGDTGTYYLYAYTSDGGWSNAYPIHVWWW